MSFDDYETTEAHERRITRCKEPSCRAQIIFLPNPLTGKHVPCDADSVDPEHEVYDNERGHVSHFTTCKAPKQFSRRTP